MSEAKCSVRFTIKCSVSCIMVMFVLLAFPVDRVQGMEVLGAGGNVAEVAGGRSCGGKYEEL